MTSGYTPKRKTGVGIKPIEIKFPDPVDFNKLRNASTIGKTTNNAKKFVDIRTRINKLGGYGLAGGGLAEATAKLKAQGLKKGGSPKKKKKFPDLSGDGKVTMKDILMARGVIKKKKTKKKGKKKWTLKKQK